MKKRLLFLDIDGVVNTVKIFKQKLRDSMYPKDGYWFDLGYPHTKHVSNIQALVWVEKLCKEYDLEIVISSSWAIGHTLDEIKECLYNSGLDKNISIIGMCEHNVYLRGQAIESFFYDKDYNVEDCVIVVLDDDSDMCGIKHNFDKYLVQTNTYVGFCITDYEKACNLIEEQIKDEERNE